MHLTILKTDSKGFKHNHQNVRVSVDLENYFNEPAGLNLTKFVTAQAARGQFNA
jgi:dGTP triphosphohydrolase